MPFAVPYASGCAFDDVNGHNMNPGPSKREWNSPTLNCASGSSVGGNSNSTVFISGGLWVNGKHWGVKSGCILALYNNNTSNQFDDDSAGFADGDESHICSDVWDVSSQQWLGEYMWSRSYRDGAGNYKNTRRANAFDIGENYAGEPIHEDHIYVCIDIDEQGFIWGVWGGHYGASTSYGYCNLQCFKSSKRVTNSDWCYSGVGNWVNKAAVCTNGSGGYPKIITGRCSCHNNWYFAGGRAGSTTAGDWHVYYSPNSGANWYEGIEFSDTATANGGTEYTYTGFNFQFDPVGDKTLLIVRGYPNFVGANYNNPGYGTFWTDCHRMSGGANLPAPTGGFFATNVDPQNVTNTNVIANNCPCAYSGAKIPPEGDIGDLESYDRWDDSAYPSWLYFDPTTRTGYVLSNFYTEGSTASTLYLGWKQFGTTDPWKSSQIWTQAGSETQLVSLTQILMVSASTPTSTTERTRYMFINNGFLSSPRIHIYGYASGPNFSSQSNWHWLSGSSEDLGGGKGWRYCGLSKNKDFITTLVASGSTGGNEPGNARKSIYLNYWNNIAPEIDENGGGETTPPVITTYNGAIASSATSVTVTATLTAGSGHTQIYYGTSDENEDKSAWDESSSKLLKEDGDNWSVNLGGLLADTSYVYRAYVSSAGYGAGEDWSDAETFGTKPADITGDAGNMFIYYSCNRYPNYAIRCWCKRWDEDNYDIIVETFLASGDRDTLFKYIKPGAIREYNNSLGWTINLDGTYSESGNTLILEPIHGYPLSSIRSRRVVVVKNATDNVTSRKYFNIKLDTKWKRDWGDYS